MIFICHYFCIYCINVPLNGIHSAAAHGGNHTVVIVSVGRPEQVGANAGDCLNLAVAAVQLGFDLVGTQLGEIGMIVRVIHDFMPGIVKRFHRFGEFIHPLAHHKKGGFHLVFPQNIDELLGVLVTPG